jgi:hypothetical protein
MRRCDSHGDVNERLGAARDVVDPVSLDLFLPPVLLRL